MNELLQKVIDELRSAWRFRWFAMAAAWLICLVGWAAVLKIPDVYEASARVFVDTRTTLSQATAGITMDSNVESQILRVRQALLGGPQLEKVARESGVTGPAMTPQQKQATLARLAETIQISGTTSRDSPTAGLYVIAYQDKSREVGMKVVERLLTNFVENTRGGKREGSLQAQRFLTEQIAEYERRLAGAEERLAAFKKANVGLMPGAQGDYFSRLQSEMDGVSKAQATLGIAQRRRDELLRQLHSEQPLVTGVTGPGGTVPASGGNDTASRIRDSQQRLDELLLRFTDKHPDVIALRETLNDLKARQQAEIEAAKGGDAAAAARTGLSGNPVYQSIQLQLNQSEVEVAALKGELSDRQAKILDLRKLVNTAPEVEAEFARLNRDYDVTRSQYQALVERLDRTRLSEEAEATGVVRFEVIDPTSASFLPVAPNRPRLLLVVLLAGLAVGAGVAYGLHMLRPVFRTPRQLTDVTGLPVLGAVSMTWLDQFHAKERRAFMVYGAVAASLVAVAAVVLLVQAQASRLIQQLLIHGA
jgi:protein tyrosine kinase modulator